MTNAPKSCKRITVRHARHAMALVVVGAMAFAASLGAQTRPQLIDGFQPGDRILLRVTGEAQLTDTFTVSPGPEVNLPIVGAVSLSGVHRDSVERVLTDAIAKYIRDPIVHARALIRVAVLGEVLRPGFYAVPSDMLLPDVLMAAGGPTSLAKVEMLHIMRGSVDFVPVDAAKKALAQGLSLAQIGVASEDQFIIPRSGDPERTLRIVTALIAIPTAIVTVLLLMKR